VHRDRLLAERLEGDLQKRLSRIVEDNSVRIDRIVEDVLSIARRERPVLEEIDVGAFVRALLADFTASAGVRPERVVLAVRADDPMRFDPHQLRLVLVNLLTNALRYATKAPGAVRVEWRAGAGDQVELRVADDGPGLPREMLAHAFEPFFTTKASGIGLGLAIVQRLMEAHGGGIGVQATSAPGLGTTISLYLLWDEAEALPPARGSAGAGADAGADTGTGTGTGTGAKGAPHA